MRLTTQLLSVGDGELPITIARAGGEGAGVVIMPSAFGVTPDLEAQMEEIAEAACVVVAIDPFFRGDRGPVPYEEGKRVMSRLEVVDREQSVRDFAAAIAWTRSQMRCESVVALGICFGGPFALLAAADGVVDGVVTWHGTRMEHYLDRSAEMRCPMRLHFGSEDPVVPLRSVDGMRRVFAGHADVQFFVHEGATHGFSHRAALAAYDARAERGAMDSLRDLVIEVGR